MKRTLPLLRSFLLPVVLVVMMATPARAYVNLWEGWVGDVYIEVPSLDYAQVVRPASWSGHYSSAAYIPDDVEVVTAQGTRQVPVRYILDDAFRDMPITTVRLGRNLSEVASTAFAGCTHIGRVEFDCVDLRSMSRRVSGDYASVFYDSRESLYALAIGPGVEFLPTYSFAHLDYLHIVNIPSSMIRIEDYAFKGCTHLLTLEMEGSQPHQLGSWVFDDKSSMYVKVPVGAIANYQGNEAWRDFNFFDGTDLPTPLSYQGKELYYRLFPLTHTAYVVCPYHLNGWLWAHDMPSGAVTIPDNITDSHGIQYNVVRIDNRALGDCRDVTSVSIGRNVTQIHTDAFVGCPASPPSTSMPYNAKTSRSRAAASMTAAWPWSIWSSATR